MMIGVTAICDAKCCAATGRHVLLSPADVRWMPLCSFRMLNLSLILQKSPQTTNTTHKPP